MIYSSILKILSVTLLSISSYQPVSSDDLKSRHTRQKAGNFPSSTTVYNKSVTCADREYDLVYPSETWACSDMRVDGKRIVYGHYTGIGGETVCTDSEGEDELAELCMSMLQINVGPSKKLWAALVNNATCKYLPENRTMLTWSHNIGYYWMDMDPGNGWIDTLRCMVKNWKV